MKRPFNILGEILLFAASFLLDIYVERNNLIRNEIMSKALNYWAFGAAWPVLVGVITIRAVRKRQAEKRSASAFAFGFVAGALVWSVFVMSEPMSDGWLSFAWAAAGIFIAGLISGFLASLWSYLLLLVFKQFAK